MFMTPAFAGTHGKDGKISPRSVVAILDRFETLVNDLTNGLPAEIAAVKDQYEYYRNKLLTFKKLSA